MERNTISRLMVICLGILTSGCTAGPLELANDSVKGSGKQVQDTRKIEKFHAIKLKVPAELSTEIGSDGDLNIDADENILSHITTVVKDGVLLISSDKSLSNIGKLSISTKAKQLDQLDIDGAATVNLSGFTEGNFELNADGASTVTATGKVKKLRATLNGAGQIKASELDAEDVKISINGAGSAEVEANNELDASINGAGSIRYKGDPKITQEINGIGSIEKL